MQEPEVDGAATSTASDIPVNNDLSYGRERPVEGVRADQIISALSIIFHIISPNIDKLPCCD